MGSFRIPSLNVNKYMSNDWKTNLAFFITFALCLGYIMNKHYDALIFLLLSSLLAYYVSKNILIGLLVGIALTNLLLSMNYFRVREGLNHDKSTKNHNKRQTNPKKKN